MDRQVPFNITVVKMSQTRGPRKTYWKTPLWNLGALSNY